VHTSSANSSALGPIAAAAFSSVTGEVLIASEQGVTVWSLASGRHVASRPELASPEIVAMRFDPDHGYLLCAHVDGSVRLLTYAVASRSSHRGSEAMAVQLLQLEGEATFFAVLIQSRRTRRFAVVAATASGSVQVLSMMCGAPLQNTRPLQKFVPLCDSLRQFAASELHGSVAIFGGEKPRQLEVWDVSGEKLAMPVLLHLETVISAVCFADSIKSLLLLSRSGTLCVFDFPRCVWTMSTQLWDNPPSSAPQLSWDEDASLLLTSGAGGEGEALLVCWDVTATVGTASELHRPNLAPAAQGRAAQAGGVQRGVPLPSHAERRRSMDKEQISNGGNFVLGRVVPSDGGSGDGGEEGGAGAAAAGAQVERGREGQREGRAAAQHGEVDGRALQPRLMYASAPMHHLGPCELAAKWSGGRTDDALTMLQGLGKGAFVLGYYSGEVRVHSMHGRLYGRLQLAHAQGGPAWVAPPVASTVALVDELAATAPDAAAVPRTRAERNSAMRSSAGKTAGMGDHLVAYAHLLGGGADGGGQRAAHDDSSKSLMALVSELELAAQKQPAAGDAAGGGVHSRTRDRPARERAPPPPGGAGAEDAPTRLPAIGERALAGQHPGQATCRVSALSNANPVASRRRAPRVLL